MDITQLPVIRFCIRYVKTYKIKSALIGGALLVLAGMGVQTLLQQVSGEPTLERTPRVSLLNVDEYRLENAVVESVGEVESLSQVELKSQVSE
ncbi:MAG TPA: hypothetical protein VFE94_01275, partial [Candidatus Paceibacterota bacterium]|nr:hypothetical protein [Candidatus Paceibacterota bacterium]